MTNHESALRLPLLAATIAPLGSDPQKVLRQLAQMGFRAIQLSATQPGMRPRELDQSARRSLAAALRRLELTAAGIDLWIPPAHFAGEEHADRAAATVKETIILAAELGRCPISFTLPRREDSDTLNEVVGSLVEGAAHHGVELADHTALPPGREGIGIGIDPAAWLSQGHDPVAAVGQWSESLVSARLSDLHSTGLRGPIGDSDTSRLDVLAYQVALNVAEYTRPVIADARGWVNPWQGLEQSRNAWETLH